MTDFMKSACDEALKGISSREGGPFGAVIVKDDEIIAAGHNMVLSSNDSTAHAEISAIRKAEQVLGTYDLKGCILYTTCFPCPMCLGAIMWARIAKVYYGSLPEDVAAVGFDDKVFYSALASEDYNGLVSLEHYANKDCSMLLSEWLKLEDRVTY